MSGAILGIGIVLALAILLPCGVFFSSPLNRSSLSEWRFVAPFSELDPTGRPELFPVLVSQRDAWMKLADTVADEVYLRRGDGDQVVALQAAHAPFGIKTNYVDERRCFRCACWCLEFDLNGVPKQQRGLSRGMLPVEAKIDNGQIYVRFGEQVRKPDRGWESQ
jgi:hypothetical protein